MRIAAIGAAVIILVLIVAVFPAAATNIGGIIGLGSMVIFAWAAVGLASPRIAKLPSRRHAVTLWGVSVVLFIVGGIVMPETPPTAEDLAEQEREAERKEAAPVTTARPAANNVTAEPLSSPTSGSLTAAQRYAVRSADSYLKVSGFSRQGLINQLSSEFGDQYNVRDATVAVDSLSIDWNKQAARSAAAYLKMSGFSCRGLIDQLSSEYGDKYTREQATYGATQAGIC